MYLRCISQVLRVLGLSLADAAPLLLVTHCSEDFTADSLLLGMQAPHLPWISPRSPLDLH